MPFLLFDVEEVLANEWERRRDSRPFLLSQRFVTCRTFLSTRPD